MSGRHRKPKKHIDEIDVIIEHAMRKHKLDGGNIFSDISDGFKSFGHDVSHVAKSAVHGVEDVGKDVAKGVKTAANDVAKGVTTAVDDVKDVAEAIFQQAESLADETVDLIKQNIVTLGKKALPYLDKFINTAVAEIPGIGPFIAQYGMPNLEKYITDPLLLAELQKAQDALTNANQQAINQQVNATGSSLIKRRYRKKKCKKTF